MPVTSMQLDDSASTDHACFADSTDVFACPTLSECAQWLLKGKRKRPILGRNP
jgi:hypothetical protein